MSSGELTPETVREWVEASCAAQGVPVTIRDHAIIAQVATLLGHTSTRKARRPASSVRKRTGVDRSSTERDGCQTVNAPSPTLTDASIS